MFRIEPGNRQAVGAPVLSASWMLIGIKMTSRKLAIGDCWHRTRYAADTLARLLPLRSDFGITRLADVTGLDRLGLPVVLAIRPNSRSVTVSHGKGVDLDAAKASGLMEAIELWHAEMITGPLWFGSCRDLQNDRQIISVEYLSRCSEGRWHPDLGVHWIEGRDLVGHGSILVPFDLVHMDMSSRSRPAEGVFRLSSNGLASGNHPLEAQCHAICELVERDALTVWHHHTRDHRTRTRIDPATIDEPQLNSLWQRLEAAGLAVAAFDITSNIKVASIYCILADSHGHFGAGSGTHPDRRVAMLRALTEAAQTRMTYITGSRDDLLAEEFTDEGRQRKLKYAEGLLSLARPYRRFEDVPDAIYPSLEADLDHLLDRLAAVGIDQVIIVDLTRDPWRIPVVRALAPSLELPHDEDGFVPGERARNPGKDLV
jgi:ribosomal protein S12 methylthiotransferase accessory factor